MIKGGEKLEYKEEDQIVELECNCYFMEIRSYRLEKGHHCDLGSTYPVEGVLLTNSMSSGVDHGIISVSLSRRKVKVVLWLRNTSVKLNVPLPSSVYEQAPPTPFRTLESASSLYGRAPCEYQEVQLSPWVVSRESSILTIVTSY